MRKTCSIILALVLTLCLAACNGSQSAAPETPEAAAPQAEAQSAPEPAAPPAELQSAPEPETPEEVELIVFAAASMTETLQKIEGLYASAMPNVKLVYNFDSSGTLKTQIQEGADCDLFISAGQKQVDQLDITADPSVNTEGLDFILEGTRINLLQNKVALVVPEGNPAGINSYEDMAEALSNGSIMLAMGNSDVPVGQYTQKILAYFKLDEEALVNSISYGTNVKEVTLQVAESSVDCGVVYSTDAYSAGLEAVDYATPEMCGQVIYPAAVIKNSNKQDEAKAFLQYLTEADATAVFEEVGFSKP